MCRAGRSRQREGIQALCKEINEKRETESLPFFYFVFLYFLILIYEYFSVPLHHKTIYFMLTDIEIAKSVKLRPINEVAAELGIHEDQVENYGRYIAKITTDKIDTNKFKNHHLILVTAISPTKAGNGKTTVSVGLALGMQKIGKKAVVALREPSLGPCFGMKGGAAGGGYAQVLPMDKINLHFTGEFPAITEA